MRKKQVATTELEVKLQGLALKTSLHGMLLLAIAFAFYVLFLTLVYPAVVL